MFYIYICTSTRYIFLWQNLRGKILVPSTESSARTNRAGGRHVREVIIYFLSLLLVLNIITVLRYSTVQYCGGRKIWEM
jgi:hypothetical protein